MATREKTETVSPAPLPRPLTTPMSRPPVSHSDSPSQPRSQISQNNGQSGSSSSSSSPLGFMKSPYVPSDSAASADNDKSLKMKIKRTKSGRQEIVKTEGGQQQSNNGNGVTNGDSDSSKTSSIPVSSSPHKVSSKEFSPASNNSLKPSDHVNGVSEMTKSEMKPSEGKVTLVNSNTASLQNSNKLKVRWMFFVRFKLLPINLKFSFFSAICGWNQLFREKSQIVFEIKRNHPKSYFIIFLKYLPLLCSVILNIRLWNRNRTADVQNWFYSIAVGDIMESFNLGFIIQKMSIKLAATHVCHRTLIMINVSTGWSNQSWQSEDHVKNDCTDTGGFPGPGQVSRFWGNIWYTRTKIIDTHTTSLHLANLHSHK